MLAALKKIFVKPAAGSAAHDRLWERLQGLSIDKPGAVLPFSQRLAEEEGWTDQQAKRAMEEYKRFIYMAALSDHIVTPSRIVDKVWHFHLQYTRSYWIEMCEKIIGSPIHHEPTQGGEEEDSKYGELYLKTLEFYMKTFGEEPPRDIWGKGPSLKLVKGRIA